MMSRNWLWFRGVNCLWVRLFDCTSAPVSNFPIDQDFSAFAKLLTSLYTTLLWSIVGILAGALLGLSVLIPISTTLSTTTFTPKIPTKRSWLNPMEDPVPSISRHPTTVSVTRTHILLISMDTGPRWQPLLEMESSITTSLARNLLERRNQSSRTSFVPSWCSMLRYDDWELLHVDREW